MIRRMPAELPMPPAPDVDPGFFVIEKDVMVPMRDGVRLAADLYLPATGGVRKEGRFPAILERTPYNKSGTFHGATSPEWAPFYASQGYVCVRQDTRGRFKSEGVWHMMTDDAADGHDTAQWLVQQPWSDGGFAMIGTSYVGGTQHALALTRPPGLKALVPVDAVADAGYFGMIYGGAYELRFMNWIISMAAPEGSRAARDASVLPALQGVAAHVREYLQHLPFRKGQTPLRLAPEYEEHLVFSLGHHENDESWKQPGLNVSDNIDDYADVPVYLIGGWYDSWALSTTRVFNALSTTRRGPTKLIMGPWIHGQHMMSKHGEVDFGPDAAIDGLQFRLRWYDRWLKGVNNGVDDVAPVRIFVMGGGSEALGADGRQMHGGVWRDEQEWPLKRTRWTPYYLQSDGSLDAERPRQAEGSTSFDFDPADPVPMIGGNTSSSAEISLAGAWDQKCGEHVWNAQKFQPLSDRDDVLVFQTEPLTRDVEVTGPIDVKLWASSTAVDTDFTAKLLDVHPPTADYPEGIDLNISDGILRARYRNSLEKPELMKPGEVYEFTIHLYPTSNLFKAGHRIRLDISSSNFPRFDVNPNTGEPHNQQRGSVVATNTIHHDRARPSNMILPIIPAAK